MREWGIISNNCWGGPLYEELGCRYNTPTVGLWFYADDYLKLLQDFRNLIQKPLRFLPQSPHGHSGYPVAVLDGGDIEIQFLHYSSEAEAHEKWARRVSRLPADDDDLFIKICDRDGFDHQHLELFNSLPFRNKIGFMKRGRFDVSGYHWAVEIDCEEPTVPDGIQLWRMTKQFSRFDCYAWVGQQRR
jgi:uncharacterized protein (DUF1919 family)